MVGTPSASHGKNRGSLASVRDSRTPARLDGGFPYPAVRHAVSSIHFLRGALAVLRVSKGSSVESKPLAGEAVALAQEFDNRGGGDVFAQILEKDSKL